MSHAYLLISISGGGTWAFPAENREEILDRINEPDNKLASLNERGELTEENFNELYPQIFELIRSRGLLIGEDVEMDEVLDEEEVFPSPDLTLPPEDMDYDEAIVLFKGEGLVPG
uniref:PspA-associated domain-containing protein n=1 Tax=Candidatus Methanogaster sp. ANME-2c ERB4 TaxID=2759911 RepID=A0A7G9YQ03_9EURY|nr:hypothetical protein NEPELPOK_00038 [Methanosarcinales archaeon ANME-2c ERB4]